MNTATGVLTADLVGFMTILAPEVTKNAEESVAMKREMDGQDRRGLWS